VNRKERYLVGLDVGTSGICAVVGETLDDGRINIVGLGVGPAVTGWLSDLLEPRFGSDSLGYALLIVSMALAGAGYEFWRASHTLADDLEVIIDI